METGVINEPSDEQNALAKAASLRLIQLPSPEP